MKFHGTKIVRNGNPKEDDVHLGWLAKTVVGFVVGLLGLGVQRAFVISNKIDTLDERTQAIERISIDARSAAQRVKDELDLRVRTEEEQHAKFISRDEFYHYMAPEIQQPKRRTP